MAKMSPKELLRRDRISRREIFKSLFDHGKSINSSKDTSTYYVLDKESKRNKEIVKLILNFKNTLDDIVIQKMRNRTYDVFIVDKNYNERKYNDLKDNAERTEIALSSLNKSPIFTQGDSSGSGSGHKNTTTNEVAQASYIQYFINNRSERLPNRWELMYIDSNKLRTGFNGVKREAPVRFDDVKTISDDWVKSSFIITHKLLTEGNLLKAGNYTVYHSTAHGLGDLIKLFKRLNKDKATGALFFDKIVKWNPADIWIMNSAGETFIKGINSSKDFQDDATLSYLNMRLKKQFDDGNIIPISLKKAVGSTNIVRYNMSNIINDFDKLELTNVLISRTSFFSSMDMYLAGKNGLKMQFRNYGDMRIQGEIKGVYAAGGKIGYSRIVTALQLSGVLGRNALDYDSHIVSKTDTLKNRIKDLRTSLSNKNPNITEETQKFKDYLYEGYIKHKNSSEGDGLDIDAFINKLFEDKTDSWIFTKYIIIAIANLLDNAKQGPQNSFLRACYTYASSQSELSAPFIKVGG